jgi:serpin B
MKPLLFLLAVGLVYSTASACLAAQRTDDASDRRTVVQGNTAFALDLYARLAAREGNLFLSPHSISTALAMTSLGARGDTAAEMARVLHFSLDPEPLHPPLAALSRGPGSGTEKGGCELRVANRLWGQRGYEFLPDFLKATRMHYGAEIQEVDFVRATEAARRTINAWVERQTADKIKDLVPERVLDADTRLVLTNAIYFKGTWARVFPKARTAEAPFHVGPGHTVQVPLMSQRETFGYLRQKTFQAVELPYVGKDLSMVVFLPTDPDGLAAFEQLLTADHLTQWLGRLKPQSVDVSLPRFQIASEFSLKKELSALGMPLAFDMNRADFSGMSDHPEGLFLAAVIHKAFVEVNEKGTEAAAATAAVVKARGFSKAAEFRADHPFLFLIRDLRSGAVLFLGRVTNPRP